MTAKKQVQGRQIGGMFISPNWIEKPSLARPYLELNAELGYTSVVMFVRHQRRTVMDAKVHEAVKAIVREGHRLGLKMILDTDHCWWGPDFVETHPEAVLWAIVPMESLVQEGTFEFTIPFPAMPGQVLFEEVSAVFSPDKGGYKRIEPSRIHADWMHVGQPKPGLRIKGQIAGGVSGNLVFYVTVKTFGVADVAHPQYLKAQESLLDAYADIPLDGLGWDEPGKGLGDLTCFKAGSGFLDFFRKQNGYDLRSRLIYLDHLEGTSQAVRVRGDYYRTLVDMNLNAQARHNRYAKKLFGDNLIFGTHQTWSGFAPDLAAGVIDYFKLGQVTTAAWTDGGWILEPKYPLHNFMLAEGLKKELACRDAYYNDWGNRAPGVEDMRYFNRLKMLFHVNWFNHCVSEYTENLLGFVQEPLRSMARQDVATLDRLDRLVNDTFYPHTDVAMLYNWPTLAAYPKWLTRAFYTFIANASLHLVDQGLYAAIMSGDGVLSAKIEKDRFVVNGLSYRVLLVPYAGAMPEAVYKKVMAISEAGIPVVFVGPPPEFASETGKPLGKAFATWLGIQPIAFADYVQAWSQQSPLPAINAWEPSWIDVVYPVISAGAQKVFNHEGHLVYVKAPDRPLYYLPGPDPREDLANLVAKLVTPVAPVFADNAYYRFYLPRNAGTQRVLVAVAKGHAASFGLATDQDANVSRPPVKARILKILVRFAEGDLELCGGTWAAVCLDGDRVAESIGDCPEVRWQGKNVICERI